MTTKKCDFLILFPETDRRCNKPATRRYQRRRNGQWGHRCDPHARFLTAPSEPLSAEPEREEPVERTGQMVDGPETGNIVSATVDAIKYEMITFMELDEGHHNPSVMRIKGWYLWSPEGQCWRWSKTR